MSGEIVQTCERLLAEKLAGPDRDFVERIIEDPEELHIWFSDESERVRHVRKLRTRLDTLCLVFGLPMPFGSEPGSVEQFNLHERARQERIAKLAEKAQRQSRIKVEGACIGAEVDV